MRNLIYLLVFLILMTSCGFHQKIQTGRAADPMRIPIRMRLPEHIRTVGGGAQYYADTVNYRLVTSFPAPGESARIAEQPINPLAPIDTTKVFPVEEGILMLFDGCLVVDQEHKLFSFEKGTLK